MALILLRRTTSFRPSPDGATWSVTSWVHNTETFQDQVITTAELENPGAYNQDPAIRAGFYCRFTTRVDVFHAASRNGTSRLEQTPNDEVACPIPPPPPPPPNPGGGAEGLNNDPKAPAGAKLLKRQCRPAPGAGFTYTDKYYDFATRSIVSLNSTNGFVASSCTTYTLPPGEVFDRFCLEPGTAPFIERRVSWDGLNELVFQDVEGVTACMPPPCTIGLNATVTQPGATGLGSVTLQATNPQGGVQYRLVGSTEFSTQTVYAELPPGSYTFEVRETRANGCTATATVELKATYGVRYRLPYKDRLDRQCFLLFRERGYTGLEEIVEYGQRNAVTIDWPASGMSHVYSNPVRGSECQMRLYITYEGQFLDTFSGDERLFQIESIIDDQLFWRGYLLPEQYVSQHLAPPREFNLSATDGLGALDGTEFAGPQGELLTGQWTLLQVLQFVLGKLELDFPLHVRCDVFPQGGTTTQCALEQVSVDIGAAYRTEKGAPLDCGKVLRAVLGAFGLRVQQQSGAWWVERIADLTTEARPYWRYAPGLLAPNGLPLSGRLRTITEPTETVDPLHWIEATQSQGLLGAVRKVSIAATPGKATNLLREQASLLPETVDASGRPMDWVGSAPVVVLPAGKPSQGGTLLIRGARPGTQPLATAFIQTPSTIPVHAGALALELTFTYTVRSTQPTDPNTPSDQLPTFYVGLRHGTEWLGAFDAPGTGPERLSFTRVDALNTATPTLYAYGRNDDTQAPVVVRFYQMTSGAERPTYDLEIKDIVLTYAGREAETFADVTEATSPLRVTRLDDGESLLHTDTYPARLAGSLLDPVGRPTEKWFEPEQPEQLIPLHSFLVRDRLLWQYGPAQTLSGELWGDILPLDLLTDPQEEERQAVYVLTSARYDATDAQWAITATQIRTLLAPAPPDQTLTHVLLREDGTPLLREDGRYLLAEDAN